MEHLVFVYGTLKRGRGANRFLQTSEYLGEGFTVPKYRMTGEGFPMIQLDDRSGHVVKGEIYRVNDMVLDTLDRYEGHPNFYTRKKIFVRTGQEEIEVNIYECNTMGSSKIDPNDNGILEW